MNNQKIAQKKQFLFDEKKYTMNNFRHILYKEELNLLFVENNFNSSFIKTCLKLFIGDFFSSNKICFF